MRHKRLSPGVFILFSALLVVLLMAGVCMLPHDRYVQFANLRSSPVVKAGWIYERIHFDPTPIDVMFIGTSHTVFGVDSVQVAQAYKAATGLNLHVVNFGIQHLGRDVSYLFAREAIEARQVKLIVIEAPEEESRDLHPAFYELASVKDLIDSPIVVNPRYLSNLARLPLRQISLFARSIAPAWFGTRLNFDPTRYRGQNWNDTYEELGSIDNPVLQPIPRLQTHTPAELEQQRVHYEQITGDRLRLPEFMRPLEYRANLIYLQRIIDLARRNMVAIRFLYLPSYRAPASPKLAALYTHFGPLWYPALIYGDSTNWLDVNHLNYHGATELSRWLGDCLAQEAQDDGSLVTASHR